MSFKVFLIFMVCSFSFAIVSVLYFTKQMKAKQAHSKRKKKHLFKLSTYMRWYRRLDNFFLSRGALRHIQSRVVEMSIYSPQEVKINTVECFMLVYGISGVTLLAGIIMFRDVFMTLLFLLFTIVLKSTLIDKQIDKIQLQVLKALQQALSSITDNYRRTESIPDAFAEAEVPDIIQRPIDEIHLILTSNDGDRRLSEFYASVPFYLLQTLAGTAYLLADKGDEKTENGSSNFRESMRMITEEIRMDIRRITKQRATFGILEYLPVAALLGMPLVMNFLKGVIPGTSLYYNNLAGNLSKIAILLSAIVGYSVIVRINSAVAVKRDDRSLIIRRLLERPWFAQLIKDITPKKTQKLQVKHKVLKNALTMINMQHLYAQKLVYSIVAFLGSLVMLIFSLQIGKEYIYNNYLTTSLMQSEELTAKQMERRIEMDNTFMEFKELPKTDEEIAKFIKGYAGNLYEMEIAEQVTRLRTKYTSYHNTYFKWWMLLICYGIGLLGWRIPELLLKWRTWLLKTEAEEDVLQLQTMIAILMNTSADILDTLYWLTQQSRIHKNALMDAMHEYPSNPELALARLKETASILEFKRMVDKLKLTVHQITLKEAFSDLQAERAHILSMREIAQDSAMKKKRTACSPLALLPIILVAVLLLLAPMGVLAVQEFTSAFNAIKQ